MKSHLDSIPMDLRELLLYYFDLDDLENICKVPQFAILDTDDNFWKTIYNKYSMTYYNTKDSFFKKAKKHQQKKRRRDELHELYRIYT